MLSEELKKILENIGSIVVIEDNQPKFLIVSYDRFKELFIHKNVDNSENLSNDINEELMERLNNEILALKEQVAEKEKELTGNL